MFQSLRYNSLKVNIYNIFILEPSMIFFEMCDHVTCDRCVILHSTLILSLKNKINKNKNKNEEKVKINRVYYLQF